MENHNINKITKTIQNYCTTINKTLSSSITISITSNCRFRLHRIVQFELSIPYVRPTN